MPEPNPAQLRSRVAGAMGSGDQLSATDLNLACFVLTRELDGLDFSVPEAERMARRLLRVVGRLLIDCGQEGPFPEGWANTEEQVLLWIDEAVADLGYRVRPEPGKGRRELPDITRDWE